MLKVVLQLELFDEKIKKKAMKTASALEGVESISMDVKDKKLTLTGNIDPVKIVAKLRKFCHTVIVSVGPAKEPEKKKDEPKKDDAKKDDKKKDDGKKEDPAKIYYYPYYYRQPYPASFPGYNYRTVEEDPNAGCVIC